jgi:AcrR family transcriptional regulator
MDDSPRARILDAAGAAFATQGFAGTSVRDICQAAGANIAAVNYYFGDKERLYIEAVKYACQRSSEKFPMPEWSNETKPAQCLYDFIHVFVKRILDPDSKPWQTQLLMRELAQPTAACAEWVAEYVQPMAEKLKSILRNLLPARTPEERVFMIGFSIVGQCLYYKQNRPIGAQLMGQKRFEELTTEAIAKHICDFTAAALGLRPPLLAPAEKKVRLSSRKLIFTRRRR